MEVGEPLAPDIGNRRRDKAAHEKAGMPWFTKGELPGLSVFLREGDDVFYTYSTYARGGDLLIGT